MRHRPAWRKRADRISEAHERSDIQIDYPVKPADLGVEQGRGRDYAGAVVESDTTTRQKFRKKLREGELDSKEIEIETSAAQAQMEIFAPPGMEEEPPPDEPDGPRRCQYAKLRQVCWRPRMAGLGHLGGHFGPEHPRFLRPCVVPLLRADPAAEAGL